MRGKALVGRILGRYRLDGELGSGGFATVYRATDTALDRPIALKVLDLSAHHDPVAARRFTHEGRALAALDHPTIVPVYDVGEEDDLLWLAMRLVEGPSLDRVLAERRLPPNEVLAMVDRLAAALDHAHALGVVHRDVKPANVLLEGGRPDRAWLTDFGIASTARTAGRYTMGPIGTAAYMAPEQGRSGAVGPAADRYALGCIAFELLTGRPPYAGDDQGQHRDDDPIGLIMAHGTAPIPKIGDPGLDRYFDAALAKTPDARPPSATTLAVGLRDVLGAVADAPAAAADSQEPAVARPRSGAWGRRLAVGGILLAAVAGVVAWRARPSGPIEVRRVTDRAGITYGVPLDWEVEAGSGSITLRDEGREVVEVTHRAAGDGDEALEELEASGRCERQAQRVSLDGEPGARCANPAGSDPAAALTAVAGGRLWSIEVSRNAKTREAEAFLSTIGFP